MPGGATKRERDVRDSAIAVVKMLYCVPVVLARIICLVERQSAETVYHAQVIHHRVVIRGQDRFHPRIPGAICVSVVRESGLIAQRIDRVSRTPEVSVTVTCRCLSAIRVGNQGHHPTGAVVLVLSGWQPRDGYGRWKCSVAGAPGIAVARCDVLRIGRRRKRPAPA